MGNLKSWSTSRNIDILNKKAATTEISRRALSSTFAPRMKMIAAACEGLGIGKNGDLPWRLKEEMKYFTRMTKAVAPGTKNAVVMGRKTYESIPPKYRPLSDRINVVMTNQKDYAVPEKGVLVCHNFEEVEEKLEEHPIDEIWLIGGSSLYERAMETAAVTHIYLTRIHANFDCDTFFPQIDFGHYVEVKDPDVDGETQREGDLSYNFTVYERRDVGLLSKTTL